VDVSTPQNDSIQPLLSAAFPPPSCVLKGLAGMLLLNSIDP
jgi:hypothetical protein